jgi:arylsulfatase A-like enzyme
LGGLVASAASFCQAQDAPKPHIVYILADDLGYGDVGALNPRSRIPTPHMDSLAKAGITFTDAHSPSAVCTPTRYGILTGRYCWRTRLAKGVLNGYDPPLIEPDRLTVPAMLRGAGYKSACIGKWHLGLGWQLKPGADQTSAATVDFTKPLTAGPHTVGFDYSYIIPASLDMDPYVYVEDGKVVEQPTGRIGDSPRPAYWRGGPIAPSFRHQTCVAELTSKAEAFIENQAGANPPAPLFLYFALTSPHTPHVPRDQFRGRSNAGTYGDFVVETDWAVGRILDALKRQGLEQNTLVILTSDNGSHTQPINRELAGHESNGPWRGQKSDALEGGHRVPFVARWPARIKAGSKCDQTICLTDLMATASQIAGVKLPDDAAQDSVDTLALLTGPNEKLARDATILHSIDGTFAVRQGNWKLILGKGSGGWSQPNNRAPADAPPVQLYDLQTDPGERTNLQGRHPERVAAMRELLENVRRDGHRLRRG